MLEGKGAPLPLAPFLPHHPNLTADAQAAARSRRHHSPAPPDAHPRASARAQPFPGLTFCGLHTTLQGPSQPASQPGAFPGGNIKHANPSQRLRLPSERESERETDCMATATRTSRTHRPGVARRDIHRDFGSLGNACVKLSAAGMENSRSCLPLGWPEVGRRLKRVGGPREDQEDPQSQFRVGMTKAFCVWIRGEGGRGA